MENIQWFKSTSTLLLLTIIFSISGCAKQTTVVLLPDPSGKVGKVTVTSDAGSAEITQAQESTIVRNRHSAPTAPKILSDAIIKKDFSEALMSLPQQPVHFVIYFQTASNKLTSASTGIIPEVLSVVQQRDSQDISIIGHADTAGDPNYNLRLSKQRAKSVAKILEARGIPTLHMKITSHGENNPLIPTKDNVHEPKNRRVEVVVR